MNSRRAWLVASIAIFAYLVAVLQRTSLGVAGVTATERFEVQAALVSSLAVVQIMMYAALQIPVGVMLDRTGPRPLIALGALLMFAGQLILALSPTIWVAIVGRLLVGAGDAMTFISVTRVIAAWFSGKTLPLMTQWMATIGSFGQVLSAVPLSFALHTWGWTPAFLGAAAASALALVLILSFVTNGPAGSAHRDKPSGWRPAIKQLRESMARPGTQLGFWSHFVTGSSGGMITLLWGFPFLSVGLGYGPANASLLLTLVVVSGMISGPILGLLSARYPYRRSNVVLGIVIAMAIVWSVLLAWPGQPPFWLVVLLLIVIAIGGPGSLIGFDFARSFNPARSLGSASGIVNVGGFLASFIMMMFIGLVLDLIDRSRGGTGLPAELYSLDSFRVAFLVQYPVVGVGVAFLLVARRRTRRGLHKDEGIEVAPLWVSLIRRWRRNPLAGGSE